MIEATTSRHMQQQRKRRLLSLAVLHTSASLTINENASPDVPLDLADALDRLAPEGTKHKYRHDDEGCACLLLSCPASC
jgi:thiamine phosphate synthase YjbQ (UPF0047 family)